MQCISCGQATSEFARICSGCDARQNINFDCPACNRAISAIPTTDNAAMAFAGRVHQCKTCGFNFFIPKMIADVLHKCESAILDKYSSAWAFLIAWNYHLDNFGGQLAVSYCDSDAAKLEFANNYEISTENLGQILWPDDRFELPNWIFEAFYSDPQALWAEILEEEDGEGAVLLEFCPIGEIVPKITTDDELNALLSSLTDSEIATVQEDLRVLLNCSVAMLTQADCLG